MEKPIMENRSLVNEEHEVSFRERLFTPRFILGLWTLMNFFTYYDRGAIASAMTFIRSDPVIVGGSGVISDAQGGAIVSAFMVGFFVTCPVFAAIGGIFNARQIITGGLIVWALACVSTSLSQSYWMVLISRMFVGVGEAAYAGYTVTIIDNMAPANKRTMWIGIFYSMIPVGTAIGMAAGGILSKLAAVGSIPGWRVVFGTEIIPMIPIIILNGFLPDKYNPVKAKTNASPSTSSQETDAPRSDSLNGDDDVKNAEDDSHGDQEGKDEFVSLPKAIKHLICNLNYVLLVFGYAMYTFVLGAIAVWAISMLEQGPLHMSTIEASLFMGGATALTGLLGAICGGLFVDKMGANKGAGAKGVVQCQKYLVGVMCFSLPCGIIAFLTDSLPLFAVMFVVGVFLLFSVTAPVNAAILSVVPLPLRTYGISFSVFFMHMLGDFPSPIIAGEFSDGFSGGCDALSSTNNVTCSAHPDCRWVPAKKNENPSCVNIYQLRNAMLIVWCFMFLSVPAWGIVGCRAARQAKREAEELDLRAAVDGQNEAGFGRHTSPTLKGADTDDSPSKFQHSNASGISMATHHEDE